MTGLIIYKGKNGATQRYAEWLSQESDVLIRLPDKVTNEHIENASYLQIVTSICCGLFQVKDWLMAYETKIKDKKVFLFVVNGMTAEENNLKDSYIQKNVPESIRQNCEVYFLPERLILRQFPLTLAEVG